MGQMGIADDLPGNKNPNFPWKFGFQIHGSPGVNYPELFQVYHSARILPIKGGFGVLLAA